MDRKEKTIAEFRKNLKIECQENFRRCKLKDLCDGTIKQGRFRILCVIKDIETENFIKGHCKKCRKIKVLWDFRSSEVYKCHKCNENMSLHLMITIRIYDQDKYETKIYMKNQELLNCLGLKSPTLKPDKLEEDISKKISDLKDSIAEFGLAKSFKRKPLMIYKSVLKNSN